MEELENRPWYEKAWDTVSTFTGEVTGYYDMKRATKGVDPVTGEELSEADRVKTATFAAAGFIPFVGWAGRAAKGGNAIYKTAKGVQAVDHSLDVYKNAKAFTTLQKTEYGIYGLASANGFSEYITGKDMFGNELSEEKRNSSLTEALFVLGVGGAGYGVDRLTKQPLKTPTYNAKANELSRIEYLSNKHGRISTKELHHRINIRGIDESAISVGSTKTWSEFVEFSGGNTNNIDSYDSIRNSYIKLIKDQSPWPEGYVPQKIEV